ncbi:MAG: two-component sensor histidine kinase [Firmicutes bacterium]|nr:two-component sensor histidine kinase [Bacillota bacterium]
MALQLQKQNKELIEKQDNEINIATLNERNRIAREIHDNVGHLLSSAILQAGALRTIAKDEKIKLHLDSLHATLAQAMDSTRDSVHKLYEESIDLNAQVEAIVQQFTFCELNYEYCFVNDPGKKLKYAFIAIVKEALSNLIKHSNATHASITFREHPALYQLIIRDNGSVKNYDPDEGMGLKNMIERVHSFKGNINIITDEGFEIFISIPKEGLQT